MEKSFVYIWIDSRHPLNKFYIGHHTGSVEDKYTHSSKIFEKFTKDSTPKGVHRRILATGTLEEMVTLEHKLLTKRKNKCWDKYYNMHTGGSYGWSIVNDNILPEVRMKNCIKGGEAFKIKYDTNPDFATEHIRKASESSKACHKDGRIKTKLKMFTTHQDNRHQQGS